MDFYFYNFQMMLGVFCQVGGQSVIAFCIYLGLGCLKQHWSIAIYKPAQLLSTVSKGVFVLYVPVFKMYDDLQFKWLCIPLLKNTLSNVLISPSESDGGGSGGPASRRPVSVFGSENSRKSSDSSVPGESHTDRLAHLSPQHFQSGRAEALGALCR